MEVHKFSFIDLLQMINFLLNNFVLKMLIKNNGYLQAVINNGCGT